MTKADRIGAGILLLFAAFVIIEARALPYWTAVAPGPGFLPFWLGVLLACAAAVMLVRSLGVAKALPDTEAQPETANAAAKAPLFVIVGLTAAVSALSLLVGLVLASGVFMGATLAYLRPGHTRANLTATALTPVVVWLVFVRWLGVPLPAGPLGF